MTHAAVNIDASGADALCGIYALRRVDKPGTYIGQSTNLRTRGWDHKKDLKGGRHRNSRMQRICAKHGDVFAFEVLCCGFDPQDKAMLTLAEQEFMDAAPRPLFNTAPAAGSQAGYKFTPEQSARASAARKGKSRGPFYEPSDAQRAAWSASGKARKGKPGPWAEGVPAELRAKMTAAMLAAKAGKPSPLKGRKIHTDETRAEMSRTRKGRTSPNKGVPRTKEQTAKQSATMRALCATLEHKKKMREAAKAAHARRKLQQELS